MSALRKLTEDDFVWTALSTALLGRQSKPGDFTSINCPMCVQRGQPRADHRFRCGVKHDAQGIGVSCFNCGFKTRWRVGDFLGRNMREFLAALGIASSDVRRMEFHARDVHRLLSGSTQAIEPRITSLVPTFPTTALPALSATVEEWAARGCEDPDFVEVVEYLFGRGEELAAAGSFHWTPNTAHGLNHRLLIPCLHDGHVIGWTARAVRPGGVPKYYSELPPNALFNTQAMARRERSVLVIVEGVLDAIAIDGLATMGARLNDQQAAWIKACGLRPVVVPDRDQAGSRLVDLAVAHGWSVSFPRRSTHSGIGAWWESDVKDAAQAVGRYGRLYTLQSILSCATDSAIEIAIKRQRMGN